MTTVFDGGFSMRNKIVLNQKDITCIKKESNKVTI